MSTGVYPATKFAITATSEAMRQELLIKKNKKVRVTSVSPGLVDTNIYKSINIPQHVLEMMKAEMLKPEDIADTICYLLSLPYSVNVNEITVRAAGANY